MGFGTMAALWGLGKLGGKLFGGGGNKDQGIDQATYDRYMQMVTQGTSAAISPFFQQASTQGAAGIAGRGGLGGGAEDALQSQLTGKKLGIIGGAASDASRQLMGQQFQADMWDKQHKWDWLRDILGAGAQGYGYYLGNKNRTPAPTAGG